MCPYLIIILLDEKVFNVEAVFNVAALFDSMRKVFR